MSTGNLNDRYTRWQGRTIEQMTSVINLLILFCLGTIGFITSKTICSDCVFNCCALTLLIIGAIVLLLSLVILLTTQINRLYSFRKTAKILREKDKRDNAESDDAKKALQSEIDKLNESIDAIDKNTWLFLSISIIIFGLGEIVTVVGFVVESLN